MKLLFPLTLALAVASAVGAAEAPLTLDEAVAQALQQSKGAQLATLKITAAEASARTAKQQRYPRVEAYGLSGYYFQPIEVTLKRGSLTPMLDSAGQAMGIGSLSSTLGAFPSSDLTLLRGGRTESIGGITVVQPITQLWRVDSGVRAAKAEATAAQRQGELTRLQIRVAVEQLFAGLLLEEARRVQYAARVTHAERQLRDAENAASVNEVLEDVVLGARATLVSAQTDLTRSAQQKARLTLQLADLIGRPGVDQLDLAPTLPNRPTHPLEYWLGKAAHNPSRQIADAVADKARAGTRAARQNYIPEVSAFATGYLQEGIVLLPDRGSVVGVTLHWDIFDFGRRGSEIAHSRALQRAAEVDRDRLEEDATREIRTTYQDYLHAGELIGLAERAVDYRRSAAALARRNTERGVALATKALAAEADLRQAEAELTGARLQQHLALLRLYTLVGE